MFRPLHDYPQMITYVAHSISPIDHCQFYYCYRYKVYILYFIYIYLYYILIELKFSKMSRLELQLEPNLILNLVFSSTL
jgi:hypothetical protein